MPLSNEAEQRKDERNAKFYGKRKDLFERRHLDFIGWIVDQIPEKQKVALTAVFNCAEYERRPTPEMQHRHFAVIAARIKEESANWSYVELSQVVAAFCVLSLTNGKFDKHRFAHACGL